MTAGTRVLFADQAKPGTVMIEPCGGDRCGHRATTHRPDRPHELSVLQRRIVDNCVTFIGIDEDGEQQAWRRGVNVAVRVRIDDVPAGAPDAEQAES